MLAITFVTPTLLVPRAVRRDSSSVPRDDPCQRRPINLHTHSAWLRSPSAQSRTIPHSLHRIRRGQSRTIPNGFHRIRFHLPLPQPHPPRTPGESRESLRDGREAAALSWHRPVSTVCHPPSSLSGENLLDESADR